MVKKTLESINRFTGHQYIVTKMLETTCTMIKTNNQSRAKLRIHAKGQKFH